MSIVTKVGDRGKTRLLSGEEVSKNSARLNTYGTLDELVASMGLARSLCRDKEVANHILQYQRVLFRLGAELATSDRSRVKLDPINKADVEAIEMLIAEYESKTSFHKGFVIPGEGSSSAALDVARTICRRFERLAVGLVEKEEHVGKGVLIFINRLSDLLFLMARKVT